MKFLLGLMELQGVFCVHLETDTHYQLRTSLTSWDSQLQDISRNKQEYYRGKNIRWYSLSFFF